MDRVHAFAVDKQMRAEVKEYIIDFMKQEIIQKTFGGHDVIGYQEAKQVIERCFANMDKEFGAEVLKEFVNENE